MNEPCMCGDRVCKNCYPDYNFDDLDAWNENADMAMRDFFGDSDPDPSGSMITGNRP